jgi:alkylation response protein AidB-like acyl-CoA dehydrogenase
LYPAQIGLNADQLLFRETVRKFLENESPLSSTRAHIGSPPSIDSDLRRQQADLGFFGLLLPEELGGGSLSGAGVVDSAIVACELGRVLDPSPILPTSIVASAVARAGSPSQQHEILPQMLSGAAVATWCLSDPSSVRTAEHALVRATRRENGFVLEGTEPYVQHADVADYLLVNAAVDGGLTQFLVPAHSTGVRVEALHCLDLTRTLAAVHFEAVEVPESSVVGAVAGAADEIEHQLALALVLQNAETVGAIDRVFEFTLAYATDRVAFGRPLASFQAIKHRLADMVTVLESCKASSAAATQAVEEDREDASQLVSVSKAYIGTTATTLIQDCVQIHGGIGVTWDHDIHLYLRRVASNDALYGTAADHRERLVELLEA